MRVDLALVERGLARSRNHAASLVEADRVLVNGKVARKASQGILETDRISVLDAVDYVSRAGFKLAKALDVEMQRIEKLFPNVPQLQAMFAKFRD